MTRIQLRRHPLHLRSISAGFLRDHNVASVRQNGTETFQHPIGAPDDLGPELRVGFIKPTSQPDPARHRINFGDDVAVIGQNQIRANDCRQLVAKLLLPRELNQLRRFARVQIFRDPVRLLPLGALLVELIAGALKNEELMSEPLQLFA